jgi:hypothetical protein
MDAFRVFISSIMNIEIEVLRPERIAAKTAIDRFAPITATWAFEEEPASAKPLLDFYLGAVKECDVFVLILGARATKPVNDEVRVACDYHKPVLAFCKDVSERTPEAMELLRSLDLKYDRFSSAMDLHDKIRTALGRHILALIRGEDAPTNRLGDRVARLRSFKREKRHVKILPTVPMCRNNSFTVEEVTQTSVRFQLGGFANVEVPVERIAEVLETGARDLPTIHVSGRLQFVTPMQNWVFFPEPPTNSDLLGFGRLAPRESPLSQDALNLMAGNPRLIRWSNRENLADREIFYDLDGRYLTNGTQILTCSRPE